MKIVTLKQDLIHTGNLILVNADYPYKENLAHYILQPVSLTVNKISLESHAVKHLSNIMDKLNCWEQITAVSGWRSMREQQQIYLQSLKDHGISFTNKFVALPGHSEHQTGLAIDLALKKECIDFLCPDFPYTGVCQTFRQNAISYGFIERYPQGKASITGIAHEPWHFRYVGLPHAEIMTKHSLVLEEYIDFLKDYPYGEKYYSYNIKDTCTMVSYLKANKGTNTPFKIDNHIPYSISGNNIDGFIITEWRNKNGV